MAGDVRLYCWSLNTGWASLSGSIGGWKPWGAARGMAPPWLGCFLGSVVLRGLSSPRRPQSDSSSERSTEVRASRTSGGLECSGPQTGVWCRHVCPHGSRTMGCPCGAITAAAPGVGCRPHAGSPLHVCQASVPSWKLPEGHTSWDWPAQGLWQVPTPSLKIPASIGLVLSGVCKVLAVLGMCS